MYLYQWHLGKCHPRMRSTLYLYISFRADEAPYSPSAPSRPFNKISSQEFHKKEKLRWRDGIFQLVMAAYRLLPHAFTSTATGKNNKDNNNSCERYGFTSSPSKDKVGMNLCLGLHGLSLAMQYHTCLEGWQCLARNQKTLSSVLSRLSLLLTKEPILQRLYNLSN